MTQHQTASGAARQYDGVAEAYATRIAPRYEAIARLLLRPLAALPPAADVLEIAIGTGLLTRVLNASSVLDAGGSWVGVDVSSDMLRLARRFVDPRVQLLLANASALPVQDACADVVVSSLGPVQESVPAFAEARRALRPGGRLAITTWDAGYAEWEMLRVVRDRFDAPPLNPAPTHDARQRAASAGFHSVETTTVTLDCTHESLDDYVAYRRAFGRPPFVEPERAEEWYALVREATSAYVDPAGRVVLDWRVTVLTAIA